MQRKKFKLVIKNKELIKKIAVFSLIGIVALTILLVILMPRRQLLNTPEMLKVKDRGSLSVGILSDMPGFSDGGAGLEIELAAELAGYVLEGENKLELVNFVPVNSKTVGAKLDDGTIDVAICMMQQNDNAGKFAYSRSYYTDNCNFLIRKGTETDLDLKGKIIGAVSGSYSAKLLATYFANLKEGDTEYAVIKYYASYPEMLAALAREKRTPTLQDTEDTFYGIDAAVISGSLARKYSGEYEFDYHQKIYAQMHYAIASSLDSPAIIDFANMMLEAMLKDGMLENLKAVYGLPVYDELK